MQGDTDGLLPCTPAGIMKLLEHAKINLEGKKVTVIGRSRIVGMPLALMLAQKGVDATVTIAHSRSKNIEQICQSSDVIIAAVGRPKFVKREWVKKSSVVVDVGISRVWMSQAVYANHPPHVGSKDFASSPGLVPNRFCVD